MLVHTVASNKRENFESEINEMLRMLKDRDAKIIDIKFSSTQYGYDALIMYEPKAR